MPKNKPTPDLELVEDADVEITYKDITVTIPRDADNWSTPAELARIKAATTGEPLDWMKFYEEALGPEQWAMVTTSLNRGDFYDFMTHFNQTVNKECSV